MKYRLTNDFETVGPKDTIVWDFTGDDCGQAAEYTIVFAEECISITLAEGIVYPFFIIPASNLEVIE